MTVVLSAAVAEVLAGICLLILLRAARRKSRQFGAQLARLKTVRMKLERPALTPRYGDALHELAIEHAAASAAARFRGQLAADRLRLATPAPDLTLAVLLYEVLGLVGDLDDDAMKDPVAGPDAVDLISEVL